MTLYIFLYLLTVDMYEILQVSREYIREFLWEKKFISDDWELFNLAKKGKKNFGGFRRSILLSTKAAAVLNL